MSAGRSNARRAFRPGDFDDAYFERHYGDEPVIDGAEVRARAAFVLAFVDLLGLELTSALDMGCGIGLWRRALADARPDLAYTGVEYAPAMCARYGWQQGSVENFQGPGADLVICQGVLQYLDDRAASRAIETLARLTGVALYLEVLTAWDWKHACDQSATDGDVFLRTGAWYRKRLGSAFIEAGGGVFVQREAGAVFYELEARGLSRR